MTGRAVAGRVLRAPVAARTWREQAYAVATLLPAAPAFALAVLGVAAAGLSLLGVGLPLLVGVLAATRPADRALRAVARAVLGWDRPAPAPVRAAGPLRRAVALLRDGARWRALLYCFVKLPLAAATAYLTATGLAVGLAFLTYPLWWFGWPTAFGLIDRAGWGSTWLLAAQAAGVLLVWPWLLRLLVGLDRLLVRALLEPSPDRARIAALLESRKVLAQDAATVLRRVERDLHDGTQARLVSLGVALGRIDRRVTDPAVRALVADAQDTVTEALVELRDIVRGLHPPALDDGLPTAVATLAARSAVPVEATVDLVARPSDATAATLYFTVAELLSNVARHAGATRVRLRLAGGADGFRLEVSDDGRGGAAAAAGTGLAGLARRAAALDGELSVSSPPGGPTTVTMTLPREG